MRSPNQEVPSRFLSVEGKRIRYKQVGDGPPLVLVHGIGRSLEDWDEVLPALGERHSAYSLDLAGFGESDRLATSTDLLTLSSAVIGFLDQIGELRPIRLAGNSLGGAVAMQIAALEPDRVAALILVDSAGFGKEVTPGLRVLGVPGVGAMLLRPSRLAAALRARSVFYDHSLATPERVALQRRYSTRPGASAVFLETARSLGTWRGINSEWRTTLLDAVSRSSRPVLVMWGQNDKILPARQLDAALRVFPGARWHSFERTGHMPQLEKPAEFIDVVASFLADVDRAE